MRFWVAVDNNGLGTHVYTDDPGRIRWHTVWQVEADSEDEAVARALAASRGEREQSWRST